jgi:flagellar assembly protein FliH
MSSEARRIPDVDVEPFAWEQVPQPRPASSGSAVPPPAALPDPAQHAVVLAALERDAFAKGYAQGERAGAEAAATRAEGMLRRLSQTIEELVALRAEIVRRTERQTVQLILAIAERVVQREVTLDRHLLVGMARAALDRLGDQGTATIRLHPDDYNVICAGRPSPDEGPVRVVPDAVVTRGGCLVQSDFGFIDAAPEAQFRELAQALFDDVAPDVPSSASHAVVLR